MTAFMRFLSSALSTKLCATHTITSHQPKSCIPLNSPFYHDTLIYMLDYNEITQRKYIVIDSTPYEVIESHVSRKQARKPINQTKLKNLITGKVTEKAFHQSDKAKEADIETKKYIYLFKKPNRQTGGFEYWFSPEDDRKQRFQLDKNTVSEQIQYLKDNDPIDVRIFDEQIIGLKIPIKVTLKVVEAPPEVKGNTAQGGNKPVVVETGATITTPLFIHEGDSIVINTDTNEYVERA